MGDESRNRTWHGTAVQGRPYTDEKDELGTEIRKFNEAVRNDDRVEVIAAPFRDGVSIIMRKCAASAPPLQPPCRTASQLV